jgi:hypothetical protein
MKLMTLFLLWISSAVYAANPAVIYGPGGTAKVIPKNGLLFPDTTVLTSEDIRVDRLGLSTGLAEGGVVTIGTPNTTVDITDGFGIISDTATTPGDPTYQKVTWSGLTGVTITGIAAANFTTIGINSAGSVVQKANDFFTPSELRTTIQLAVVLHESNVQVDSIASAVRPVASPSNNLGDLSTSVGAINRSGNLFGPNGANLNIDKSAGETYSIGSNYATDMNSPNIITTGALAATSFRYIYKDGVGGYTVTATTTAINGGDYDDGTGTLNSVGNNNWSVQRIYFVANTSEVFVHYGQEEYATKTSAISGIISEAFTPSPGIARASFRAWLVIKGNASDLSNVDQAIFVEADKFGQAPISGGINTLGDFQEVYENSVQPQIVLDATRLGLQIRDNATPIANPLFEILDNGALANYFTVEADLVSTDLDISMDGTGQLKLPEGTTDERSGTPLEGMARLNSETKQFEGYRDGLWRDLSGKQEVKNYIDGHDAELTIDSSKWVQYRNTVAGDRPDDFGGSTTGCAGISIDPTVSASLPLEGDSSYKFVKGVTNIQGCGFYQEYYLDKGDLGKYLTVDAMFLKQGSMVDNDISLWNVCSNDNFVSDFVVLGSPSIDGVPISNIIKQQLRTDPTRNHCRFAIHYASTTTQIFDFWLDEISLAVKANANASVVGDWKSDWTPTGTWTTNTTYKGKYRQVGDSGQFMITVNLSGVPNSSRLSIDLPSGLEIDTDKLAGSTVSDYAGVGTITMLDSGNNFRVGGAIYRGSPDNRVEFITDSSGSFIDQSNPFPWNTNNEAYIELTLPIKGWSASAATTSDLGNREISFFGNINSSATINANTENIPYLKVDDSSGSWSDAGREFTIKETGLYDIAGSIQVTSGTAFSVYLYINEGSGYTQGPRLGITGQSAINYGINSLKLNAGSKIAIRFNNTKTLSNIGDEFNYLRISKLAPAQTKLETPTVAARYTSDSGTSLGTALTDVIYEDIDFDTHNAYNPSTGEYTVPHNGFYQINARFRSNLINTSSGYRTIDLYIYINGTAVSISSDDNETLAFSSSRVEPMVSDTIYLEKGQIVKIRTSNSLSASMAMDTESVRNVLSISRIK